MPESRTKRRRRVSAKGLAAAAAVLVALVALLEIGLRAGLGLGSPVLLQIDADVGYYPQANQDLRRFGRSVRINAHHQRSPPVTDRPAAGIPRVLVVGDSVAFGGTLTDQAETLTSFLALELAPARGGPVEVLNASAGSWGVGNQLAYLRKFGTFGSHVVVLQIGTHDLTQEKSTGAGKIGVLPHLPDRPPRSAITELIGRYVLPLVRPGPAPADAPGPPPDPEASFARNLRDVAAAVQLARDAGAAVVVLHTPDRDEVVAPGSIAATGADAHRARLLARCATLDVAVVDLHAGWRDAADAPDWFRDGVHLTPRGNRAAARAMRETVLAALASTPVPATPPPPSPPSPPPAPDDDGA